MQCLASSFYLAVGPSQGRWMLGTSQSASLKPECALEFVKTATLAASHPGILQTQTVFSEMGSAVPGPFALGPLRGAVLSFQSKKREVWKSVKPNVKTQILATFLWKYRYWLFYFQMETPCCRTWKHVCFLILTLRSEIILLSVNFFFFFRNWLLTLDSWEI